MNKEKRYNIMSASSPRKKKKFPTLHAAVEFNPSTSPTTTTAATTPTSVSTAAKSSMNTTTATTAASSSPSSNEFNFNSPLRLREVNNQSPPTVPYTINDMNAGINHIITEAMVREQLNQSNNNTTAVAPAVVANNHNTTATIPKQPPTPTQQLLKGLTTTCDGSYGQHLIQDHVIPSIETVPVEDVMRWKEFRRKQRSVTAITTATLTEEQNGVVGKASSPTSIDVDGFPTTSSDNNFTTTSPSVTNSRQNDDINDGENDITSMPKKQQQQQQSISTTTTSALSSHGNSHSSDVGTDIVSNTARYLANKSNIMARQLIEDDEEEEEGLIRDNDNDQNSHDMVVKSGADVKCDVDRTVTTNNADEGNEEFSPSRRLDEVHNFMKQLKQKSAVGSRDRVKSSLSSDNNNNNNSAHNQNMQSPPPPITANDTPGSPDVHKSLIEHRERMRQQKLEGQRKRDEFDARLKILRSKLHGSDGGNLGNTDGNDDAIGLTIGNNSSSTFDSNIKQDNTGEECEKDDNNNNGEQQQQPISIMPGARWSGGLAVWSPSNESGVKRSKSTPPKFSSPSRQQEEIVPQTQPQSTKPQQEPSTPLQELTPPMAIGIDEDDFSFCPVDVDAILPQRMSSDSMSTSSTSFYEKVKEGLECPEEAFTVTKSSPQVACKDEVLPEESVVVHDESQSASISPPSESSLPVSNVSPDVTEGDRGGGLGSGYLRGIGSKSVASSVNVELGFSAGVDPPLNDEESSEKEDETLLGVTVVGSKKRGKRKSSSLKTKFETVKEQDKDDDHKEDESVTSMEDDEDKRDPSPVAFEPMAKDAPPTRKQLDPDGFGWKEIDTMKREARVAVQLNAEARTIEPIAPSCSEEKVTDEDDPEMITDNDHLCPDNIFSPRNNHLPPVTPRVTPVKTSEGQWDPTHHFTPKSKLLTTTPRATPRTSRVSNLSSNRKFGFGWEANSPDTSFKMNEKPLKRSDVPDASSDVRFKSQTPNKDAGQGSACNTPRFTPKSYRSNAVNAIADSTKVTSFQESTSPRIRDNNTGNSPTIPNKHSAISQLRSKFESNTFGIDHLQKSLQQMREEKAADTPQSPLASPIGEQNAPSRIYLEDRDLKAMSSLEVETQESVDYSLNKGVSEDNDITIGDTSLGDGTMDTRKALRYAKRLRKMNLSEDPSKENHDDKKVVKTSIVAQRRRAFENQPRQSKVEASVDGVLASQQSVFSSSSRGRANSREGEAPTVRKSPSYVGSLTSQASSGGRRSVGGSYTSQASPGGRKSVVSSIKERIATYDAQSSKNDKSSPYRLSNQSKTFQLRVGGQVKSINIQKPARSEVDAGEGKVFPSWATAQRGPHSPAPANSTTSNSSGVHRIQYGSTYSSNESSNNRSSRATAGQTKDSAMPLGVTPIDTTRYESPEEDDDDGITLSPTISEVSGLTLPTVLNNIPVPPNDFERHLSPIGRLRQNRNQANRSSSCDYTDAPTQRSFDSSQIQKQRSSRRDQIVSRIRERSNNGNLWQRRNVVTEVSHSTSGTASASGKSQNATRPGVSVDRGLSCDRRSNHDNRYRHSCHRGEERVSVANRVATMNLQNQSRQQHHKRINSSQAASDCLRVD